MANEGEARRGAGAQRLTPAAGGARTPLAALQGTPGDYFYIVESGTFDVFVTRPGGAPTKVTSYSAGAGFGELALMYNAPRYARARACVWCGCPLDGH